LYNRFKAFVMATVLALLASMILLPVPTNLQASPEHIYYGYVPPSTDVFNPGVQTGDAPWERAEASRVDEIIKGTLTDYIVPSGMTLLDIAGLEDDTSIEIWDIYANQEINSTTIDKFEKKTFFMPVGTFFKIVASKRIAALLNGGASVFEPDGREEPPGGTSTFYPAVTGGFRGREFIFNAAPATHPFAYSADRIGYNFYLFGLEETDWTLSDAVEVWSTSEHLRQRGTRTMLLQSRFFHQGTHGGAGNDVVFRLTTTRDAEVSSCTLGDFVAVPALTGGYVGRLFYAPIAVSFEEAGRTGAYIVVPLEEGEVKVYDKELNLLAAQSFSASDVEDRNYWYRDLGIGRFNLIAESTGDITFMVGQTEGTAEIG